MKAVRGERRESGRADREECEHNECRCMRGEDETEAPWESGGLLAAA